MTRILVIREPARSVGRLVGVGLAPGDHLFEFGDALLEHGDGHDRPNPAGGEVDTGVMAASLVVGTIQKLDLNGNTITVVLGRDGMGYYAMDGICTHTGCPVRYLAGDRIIGCTCNHGSTFAFDGALLSPATSGGPIPNQPGLPHFAMRIAANGRIFVDVGRVVPQGMRYQAM